MGEGVFEHLARAELDEEVPRHVVGEISEHYGSSSGFVDCATVNLEEVEVSVDVHLAVLVLQDASGGKNLTIILGEVEKCLQLIDVGTLHEVRRVNRHFEPARHCELLVAVHAVVWVFVDRHVYVEGRRVEVEHDSLLTEAEAAESAVNHFIYVVVKGLLDVDGWRID